MKNLKNIKTIHSILFFTLILSLFIIQIINNNKYQQYAYKNYTLNIKLDPPRGQIYDINNILLADNEKRFRLSISKKAEIKNPKIQKIIENYKNINITQNQLTLLLKILKLENIPNKYIKVVQKSARHYIYPNITSHYLGYVNNANTAGLDGIEKFHNSTLNGEPGFIKFKTNSRGEYIEIIDYQKPKAGQNIQVMFDVKLQQFIDSILKPYPCASVVIMHLPTGQVRALYSKPSYNSNYISNGYLKEDWQKLMNNPSSPMLNRPFKGKYPPGSIMKIVSSIAAFEADIIQNTTKVNCPGFYQIGKTKFRCASIWHGTLDFLQAFSKSCDVYFYSLSNKLKIDQLLDLSSQLILSTFKHTGIDSLIDQPLANSQTKETQANILLTIIGQGKYISATPLELCTMIARVATGLEISPMFDVKHNNQENNEYPSQKEFPKLKISENVLHKIRQGLRLTVTNGTARLANSSKVKIYGKTGTSQVVKQNKRQMLLEWKYRDHALFTCYTKNYACCIVVDHGVSPGKYAGHICCPLAKQIMEYLHDNEIKDT